MIVDECEGADARTAAPATSGGRPRFAIGASAFLIAAVLVYLYVGNAAGAPTILDPQSRRPAPLFRAPDFAGGEIALADLRGRPVVLNFWASWCAPCRAEARDLERVWDVYRDRGVAFLGVDIQDTEEDARVFLREFRVSYPNVLDATSELAVAYAISGIPTTYFIDPEGRVAGRWVGPMTEQQLVARIEELLR